LVEIRERSGLARRGGSGLADGALLAKFGAPTGLARLLVVFPLSQFFLNAAALEQFLESSQRQPDRLSVVNTHPQRHTVVLSFLIKGTPIRSGIVSRLEKKIAALANIRAFST
jgi:hypothetical protein